MIDLLMLGIIKIIYLLTLGIVKIIFDETVVSIATNDGGNTICKAVVNI